MMDEDFGDVLRRIRKERGMTLEEMAKLLGTTKQALSRYERGQRTPKITVAARFADLLGVDLSELIGYEYHDSDPTFEDAAIGEDLSKYTADEFHCLEDLHQDPRLGLLFDRARRMSDADKEKMIQIAGVILGELYPDG